MKKLVVCVCVLTLCFTLSMQAQNAVSKATRVKKTGDTRGGWEQLISTASSSGKPEWRPMLVYLAGLHQKNTHAATEGTEKVPLKKESPQGD